MNAHALLACVLAAGSGTALAAQSPVFSARADLVRVDVLVTDGGRIVRGLRPDDFEIRDEGVPQRVQFASLEQLPLNVVLALDTSHSVSGEPLQQLQLGGQALVDALRDDDRAAVVTFDDQVSLRVRPTPDRATVRATLERIEAAGLGRAGATALADATYTAMVVSDRAASRPLVVVFSDGVDTGSWLTPELVLDAARRLNVVVYGVTVRGSGDASFLRDVAKVSGGGLLEAESIRDVRSAFVRILEEFRDRYVLSYSPEGVSRAGWHRLDVRVKGRSATVKGRAGYMAGP